MLGIYRFTKVSIRCMFVAMLAAAVTLVGSGAPAQESLRESTSLQFIPADAAFYSSTLRLREQYRLLADSNAMKQLLDMPIAQDARKKFDALWGDDSNQQVAIAKAVLDQPENKQLVELLKDL